MTDLKNRLSNAAVMGETRLVELLLEKGVDVHVHANDDERFGWRHDTAIQIP